MTQIRSLLPTTLLTVLCLACLATARPSFAATDMATLAARSEGDVGASSHDLVQGAHVEGHIAFLKAELGITSAQETLWSPVAAAMREDVRNLQEAETKAG